MPFICLFQVVAVVICFAKAAKVVVDTVDYTVRKLATLFKDVRDILYPTGEIFYYLHALI